MTRKGSSVIAERASVRGYAYVDGIRRSRSAAPLCIAKSPWSLADPSSCQVSYVISYIFINSFVVLFILANLILTSRFCFFDVQVNTFLEGLPSKTLSSLDLHNFKISKQYLQLRQNIPSCVPESFFPYSFLSSYNFRSFLRGCSLFRPFHFDRGWTLVQV